MTARVAFPEHIFAVSCYLLPAWHAVCFGPIFFFGFLMSASARIAAYPARVYLTPLRA